MDHQQSKEIVDCLVQLIKRIATKKKASPAEIEALPEIVKALYSITEMMAM